MTKTIINLTLSVVTSEIEDILATYPDHPYQQVFSVPGVRQKLVCYVLSRMPGSYTVMDDAELAGMHPDSLAVCSVDQRHQISELIHRGIEHILQEDSDWVEQNIPEQASVSLSPSSWFG